MTVRAELDFIRVLSRCRFGRVVVPSRTVSARKLALRYWTPRFVAAVVPYGGGATVIAGRGYWRRETGQLIAEPVRIVEFYLQRALRLAHATELTSQLRSLAGRMEQEALAVAVEHRLFLLCPSDVVVTAAAAARRRMLLEMAAAAEGGDSLQTG